MQALTLDTDCITETETQKVKEDVTTSQHLCFPDSQLQNSEGKQGPLGNAQNIEDTG